MRRFMWLFLAIVAFSLPLRAQQQTATSQVVITVANPHSVTLTWTASVSSGVAGYAVFRGTAAGQEGASPLISCSASPCTDTQVVSGTTYFYKVAAVNGSGNWGSLSSEASATVP